MKPQRHAAPASHPSPAAPAAPASPACAFAAFAASLVVGACSVLFAFAPASARAGKTENVVIMTWDGYRHQELFGGANEFLVGSKGAGGQPDPDALKERYWRESPEQRREIITPFVWGTIAKQGQIFGDAGRNAPATITNTMKFSYPGYSEMFCGLGDPRIDSNDKKDNPNLSVLEFLDGRPGFKGRVAAIATWGVFTSIFRAKANGLPVYDGWRAAEGGVFGDREASFNEMVRGLPRLWPDNTYDLLTFEAVRGYVPAKKPRVLFIGLGETDEWAHARRYDLYLDAARNSDAFAAEVWNTIQSTPEYKDKTTLILTTDHGRGETPADWTSHGKDTKGAEYMWIAVIGPDTPALGVRENVSVTQAQIAATIAALLGEDFRSAVPAAAPHLPGVGAKGTE